MLFIAIDDDYVQQNTDLTRYRWELYYKEFALSFKFEKY